MIKNPMEGRIAEIQFDSGRHFRIDFLPENKLRWTSIRKQDYGATDVETTHVEILGDGIFAIDWIEKSGLCVSYSVDVNAQFVKSYMSWADSNGPFGGRDFLTHEGPFFFIQDNGERDLRPFTSLEVARSFCDALSGGKDIEQVKSLLADDFVFQGCQTKLGKSEFLSAVEEKIKKGEKCCYQVLSSHVDKDTVFIETKNCEKNGSAMHVCVVRNQQVSSYNKIG